MNMGCNLKKKLAGDLVSDLESFGAVTAGL